MRQRLLNLSLLVASTLLVEVLLRLIDPLGMAHFAATRTYVEALEFGAPWGYLHRPGHRARIQGVEVVINEHGLRGPSTPTDKPAGTKRLLILGDSAVFGWGAPQDSIFPARLQRRFAAHDSSVEVIAAGVSSWNTRTEYEWLRARGLAFEPDVLVLLVVGNDADPIYVGHTDVPRDSLMGPVTSGRALRSSLRDAWRNAYQRSRILACVQYVRVYIRQRSLESAGYSPESPQWRDATLALDGIIDLCSAHEIELVVFLYGDEERVEASGVLRAYRDHLARRGFVAHALPSAVFTERRYQNSIVDGHQNSAGHAIQEEAVGAVVAPLLSDPD